MKVYPKSFRTKRSFVISVPGAVDELVERGQKLLLLLVEVVRLPEAGLGGVQAVAVADAGVAGGVHVEGGEAAVAGSPEVTRQ
jgi:hypothetical protein